MTLSDIMSYLFVETSQKIFELKAKAYQATEHEKYAYVAPDKKSFRNKRPPERLIEEGWVFEKVKFLRVSSHINPKHTEWDVYQHLKHRATVVMAARLFLRATEAFLVGTHLDGLPADKGEVPLMVETGFLSSQAKTLHDQKRLGLEAYDLLVRTNNKLRDYPERFAHVEKWLEERKERV